MKSSLEVRVITIVGGMIIAVALSVGFIMLYTLNSVTISNAETIAQIVRGNIEGSMISGKADITRESVQHLKVVRGIEEITVVNSEGREAFRPESAPLEAGLISELKSKLQRGKETIVREEKGRIILSLLLRNSPSCQRCHGPENTVLGAVKVSLFVQKEKRKVIALMLGAVLIVSVLFFSLLWFRLKRLVLNPVRSINAAALKISEGDLSFAVGLRTDDEIGVMSRIFKDSFRALWGILRRIKGVSGRIGVVTEDVDKESKNFVKGAEVETEAFMSISSSVEELNATAEKIAESTETLTSSVEETSASIEEMASSINNVNDSIHSLSASVDSTSSSIEELSATIKEVAAGSERLAEASEETLSAISEITSAVKEVEANAKESAKLSEQVTIDASTFGMASIEKTMEGMKNIKASVEHTAEFISKLGGRSDEIGKILNVIDEVTDQTSLLALNAAILASQAGEHGKGFSVVAEEIKDLAERTALSTQEISSLIQSVQSEVKSAVSAMREGLLSVEEGFVLSREAADALIKIVESSKKSSGMAVSIERSTTEQAKAAKLVTEAMERVRNMTEQIAKATAEESKGVHLIMGATERVRDSAQQVNKATEEQVISGRQIAKSIELVSDQSRHISGALSEHRMAAKHILNIVAGVKEIPEKNRKMALKVISTLRKLREDAELLSSETARFKFSDGKEDMISFGVVPLESPAAMFKKFSPLAAYISRKIGKPVEVKVAVDFEGVVRDLGENVTQLSFMTSVTYLDAHEKYGVKAMVKALRNGKPFHRAVIIVRADSGIKSVAELKGKSFAFSDSKSASGHIMPRVMLKSEGVDIKDLGHYDYLGHHDNVAQAVLKKEFDAGAVMESVANKFRNQGLKLLKFSDEIPEVNICYNTSLDEKDMTAIRTALVSLNDSSAEGAAILKLIDSQYTGFTQAEDSDYDNIRAKKSRLEAL